MSLGTAIAIAGSAITLASHVKSFIVTNQDKTGEQLKKDVQKLGNDFIMRDSLISYTKSTRVEPITLVDERIVYQPYISDVLQTANSIFAAYYLQALSVDNTIGSVSVLKRLDKFNPERSAYMYSAEDFSEGLPKFSREQEIASMEANYPVPYKKQHDSVNVGNTARDIREAANLAVGKIFDVKFKEGEVEYSIPVAVRLAVNTVDSSSLIHILGIGKDNKSSKARYHAWRSGELKFFRDIVMAEDLIQAHKSAMGKDKSGVYAEILKRRSINMVSAVASQEISIGTASNIAIISDVTRKELEFEIGGKLSDYNVRNNIFKDTYMMLLFVIDAEYEHVTIYHRGIHQPTDLSIKELRSMAKGNGPDVNDILKAFVKGDSPF